jgi:hypothetical protein
MKIYLAIPYTGSENESFRVINLVAGMLINQGHIVLSPVSHTHPIAVECDLPKDWKFWKRQDESFIGWCDELHIVKLNGYEKSKGVNAEIKIAKRIGKPIKYIEYKNEIKIEFSL